MSRGDRQAVVTPARSRYLNYFEVAQNPLEFLLELGQYRPARGSAPATLSLHTHTVMSPACAKLLSEALARAVSEHEKEYEPVADIPAPNRAKPNMSRRKHDGKGWKPP